ncbi:uncharacterized protein LOC129272623 [Lytechinus pictus]|uniref:uncharacterized protein LOC129272623 n=1 Tax=Lytechinus pictus TaxID=7653 RepID=UPI0030B9C49A
MRDCVKSFSNIKCTRLLGRTRPICTSSSNLQSDSSPPISRFPIPDRKTLPDDLQEVMDEVEEKGGFLPNVFKMLSYHPDSFRSFFKYYNVLMEDSGGNLTKADKEMIVVATSSVNNCMYCIVAHSALHRIYSKNQTLADEIVANEHMAALDSRQRAILDLALAVCKNEPITGEHFSNLEAHGLDQEDAFMVGSVAAFFAMSNRLAHLTSCRPNKEFHLLGRIPREKK